MKINANVKSFIKYITSKYNTMTHGQLNPTIKVNETQISKYFKLNMNRRAHFYLLHF